MNHGAPQPLPPGMPSWLGPAHLRLRSLVEKLPVRPPSFVLARVLDKVLLPRLPADARAAMTGRCIEMCLSDFGARVRLQLTPGGFVAAPERAEPELRIMAPTTSYLRLMRGDEDPDRLFFERALVMEGDTELGLVLKNTLDAIGPLWPFKAAGAAPH